MIRTLVGQGLFDADTAGEAEFTMTPVDPASESVTYELRRLMF